MLVIAIGPLALVLAIKDRRWREILAVQAGLAMTTALAFPVWLAGDYVHLGIAYALHADEFVQSGGQPVSIAWNNNGWAGISCDRYLVYDPSGRAGEGSGPGQVYWHLTSSFHIRTDCR